MIEMGAIPEHLLRDLRNPMIDVSESEAALSEHIRMCLERAWDECKHAYFWTDQHPVVNPYRATSPAPLGCEESPHGSEDCGHPENHVPSTSPEGSES